jgi:lipoate-protein ligase A
MAQDEAILAAVSQGSALPTLRLYRWEPPCLSLGYGQRVDDVDLERLAANSWEIVRRATGGKAILHADELTYSVTLPNQHPLAAGGVIESYLEISKALLAALRTLGLHPQADEKREGGVISPVCFETASHYEITLNGKKLIGSAQVRRKAGVLQHGTLPLNGDVARICEVLRYDSEAARERAKAQIRERATTLETVCDSPSPPTPLGATASCRKRGEGGRDIGIWPMAAVAVAYGFETTFGITFERGELMDSECERAARLAQEVYGNEAWTMRR